MDTYALYLGVLVIVGTAAFMLVMDWLRHTFFGLESPNKTTAIRPDTVPDPHGPPPDRA